MPKCWYSITSDAAWQLAQERGYKTVDKRPDCRIRFVHCTKDEWLDLDPFHQWLQRQYERKQ